jgi:hypothetical protein
LTWRGIGWASAPRSSRGASNVSLRVVRVECLFLACHCPGNP